MEIRLARSDIFPEDIRKLLQTLYRSGFFAIGLLVGSWVFPLYKEAFKIHYALKTFDIDFAVDIASLASLNPIDLEKLFADLGYIHVVDYGTGLRKYSRAGFEIEFLVHRPGNRDRNHASVRQLNITATPLPFLNIIFQFPFVIDVEDFKVRIPCPEALFVHKLIIAQRRSSLAKRENDLSQCKALISGLKREKLSKIIRSLKMGPKTRKAIIASCETIDFPPHKLGLT